MSSRRELKKETIVSAYRLGLMTPHIVKIANAANVSQSFCGAWFRGETKDKEMGRRILAVLNGESPYESESESLAEFMKD
jgi:hypothetical protein